MAIDLWRCGVAGAVLALVTCGGWLGCGAEARRGGAIHERAMTLERSSRDAALRGDLARAVSLQEQALASYRNIDAPSAAASNRLGNLRQQLGDLAGAQRAYLEALARARQDGDTKEEAAAESNIGTVIEQEGDLAGARTRYEAARRVARTAGDPVTEATALNNLAMLAVQAGDLEGARALLDEAISLDRRGGDAAGLALHRRNLAVLDLRAGRLDAALAGLEEALALDRRREDVPAIALGLVALSEVRARAGDLGGAVGERRRAREIHWMLGLEGRVRADDAAIASWCERDAGSLDCELAARDRSRDSSRPEVARP